MKKAVLYVVIPVLVLLLTFALIIGFPKTTNAVPMISAFPVQSFQLDIVIIPDDNLNAALHQKTGTPSSEFIKKSALAALNGTLDLTNKHIANAQGIQFCTNIETLDLSHNDLAAMPSGMDKMTKLKTLRLYGNKLTTVPSQLFPIPKLRLLDLGDNLISSVPTGITAMTQLRELKLIHNKLTAFPSQLLPMALENLNLAENELVSIPDGISGMDHLTTLKLTDTNLDSIPASLYTMSKLKTLYLDDNHLTSISPSISGMTQLTTLYLDNNELESLPGAICGLPNLTLLTVIENNLYSLPSEIGHSKIQQLYVVANNISSLPKSLGESTELDVLNANINRLTSLPSTLHGKHIDEIGVNYNFIDMSAGSPAREIMDSIVSDFKGYKDQLVPVRGITAQSAPDSIKLSWQPGQNGHDGDVSWSVKGYTVYLVENGDSKKLADLDAGTQQYAHTGLTPATAYKYRIGIDYLLDIPNFKQSNRCYTDAEASTAAAGAAPSVTVLPEAAVSPSTEASLTPAEAEVDQKAADNAMPVWLIAVICVAGAAVVGAAATVSVLQIRKARNKAKSV